MTLCSAFTLVYETIPFVSELAFRKCYLIVTFHIFPKWLQKEYHLKNTNITLKFEPLKGFNSKGNEGQNKEPLKFELKSECCMALVQEIYLRSNFPPTLATRMTQF